jgi:hypothetical protein
MVEKLRNVLPIRLVGYCIFAFCFSDARFSGTWLTLRIRDHVEEFRVIEKRLIFFFG